jgi:DNA-binding transcriptional ArsR family regulator
MAATLGPAVAGDDRLDRLFAALDNRHRRGMIELLALQPSSISRLARARGLSLPAMDKHVRILEAAGLVRRRKTGRTTFLALDRSGLLAVQGWLGAFHAYWGSEAETLENYTTYLEDGA